MQTFKHGERASVADLDLPIPPLHPERVYCRITGESLGTARRNRLLGKGCPYVKLGARVFYRTEDIERYIANNVRGRIQTEAK